MTYELLVVLKATSQPPVVWSLAICGAIFTSWNWLGSILKIKFMSQFAPFFIKFGYGCTGLSVFLFIVAGFISDLTVESQLK